MKVGVFTALLSALPFESVLEKLSGLNVHTVELGTGNYPGDPHCKLSMLNSANELTEFRKKLDDYGFTISALSSHGNPLHPDQQRSRHDRDVGR
jgi:sugar phosphate isomerase/epimerase